MGATITYEEMNVSKQKIQDLQDVQQKIRNKLQQMPKVKGKMAADSEILTSINDKDGKQSLFKSIVLMLKAQENGPLNYPYDIIVDDLNKQLDITRSTQVYMQKSRSFPILSRLGFAMGYLIFYLEKLSVKIGASYQEHIVMMCAYKVIIPSPPRTRIQLAGYVATSSVPQEHKKQILLAVWVLILQTWPIQQLQKMAQKSKAIQELRKIRTKQ